MVTGGVPVPSFGTEMPVGDTPLIVRVEELVKVDCYVCTEHRAMLHVKFDGEYCWSSLWCPGCGLWWVLKQGDDVADIRDGWLPLKRGEWTEEQLQKNRMWASEQIRRLLSDGH